MEFLLAWKKVPGFRENSIFEESPNVLKNAKGYNYNLWHFDF
jgi:hypothetical protein